MYSAALRSVAGGDAYGRGGARRDESTAFERNVKGSAGGATVVAHRLCGVIGLATLTDL